MCHSTMLPRWLLMTKLFTGTTHVTICKWAHRVYHKWRKKSNHQRSLSSRLPSNFFDLSRSSHNIYPSFFPHSFSKSFSPSFIPPIKHSSSIPDIIYAHTYSTETEFIVHQATRGSKVVFNVEHTTRGYCRCHWEHHPFPRKQFTWIELNLRLCAPLRGKFALRRV